MNPRQLHQCQGIFKPDQYINVTLIGILIPCKGTKNTYSLRAIWLQVVNYSCINLFTVHYRTNIHYFCKSIICRRNVLPNQRSLIPSFHYKSENTPPQPSALQWLAGVFDVTNDYLVNGNKSAKVEQTLKDTRLIKQFKQFDQVRIDALKLSHTAWRKVYKSFQECQEQWKVASPEAFNLRDELLQYFYHALYNLPAEYAKVKRISVGSTNADMIQDLIELSELGKDHISKLEAVGLDLKLLDKARASSFELGKLLVKVIGAQSDTNPKIELRNKAYTHLKEAVDEIRRHGQFAFWRKENRLSHYASRYLRKMNEPRKQKEVQTPEETE